MATDAASGPSAVPDRAGGPSVQRRAKHRPAKERILDSAREGLSQLDPAGLSIQRVCARAGVTAPTLYYHYGSKDGLTAAAVDAMVTDWMDQIREVVAGGQDLDSTLDLAVEGWHDMVTSSTRPFAVFVWVAMWSPESRETLIRARGQARQQIAQVLERHVETTDGAEEAAGLVLDAVVAAAVNYQIDADDDALRRRLMSMARLVRLWADGLARL